MQANDAHIVERQCARLVEAGNFDRGEPLDRAQPADDDATPAQILDCQRERRRGEGRQTLGDRRDRERGHGLQQRQQPKPADQPDCSKQPACRQRSEHQLPAERVELSLQGCRRLIL